MAKTNYNAVVYCDGERMDNRVFAPIYADCAETLIENYGWLKAIESSCKNDDEQALFHRAVNGVLGDGNIRVLCFKQCLPLVFEKVNGVIHQIDYLRFPKFKGEKIDGTNWGKLEFEYNGYKFKFKSRKFKKNGETKKPYIATMTTPDGYKWKCKYDYGCWA